jgi:prephenate dehydratase
MLKDLTIRLKNKPGILADLGELLGKHNINMEALCGIPLNEESMPGLFFNLIVRSFSI